MVDFRNLDCIIAKTDLYRLFFFVDAAREKTRGSALAPLNTGVAWIPRFQRLGDIGSDLPFYVKYADWLRLIIIKDR